MKNTLWSGLLCMSLLVTTGCLKRHKKPDELSFNELKEQAVKAMNEKETLHAIAYLQQMMASYPENQDISTYRLMLADLYFDRKEFKVAHEAYKAFCQFYPSDPKTEYAAYRAIQSKMHGACSYECDTSDLKDAVELCDGYLKNPAYQAYRGDVQALKRTGQRSLIDKEVYVYDFYLRDGKYEAAAKRLSYIEDTFCDECEDVRPRVLYLQSKLAKKQKDPDGVLTKVEELVDRYPDSQFTRMARGLVTNDRGLFIF